MISKNKVWDEKSKFITMPNLPQANVTKVVFTGEPCYKYLSDNINDMGIGTILTSESCKLQKEVSFHPDMLIHHLCDNNFVVSSDQDIIISKLATDSCSLEYINSLKPLYPDETMLNVVNIDKKVFCNEKNVSKEVISYYKNDNYKIVHCNQSYTKCSSCIVNNNTVITSDKGLEKVYNQNGLNTLLIDDGDVILKGYDYGFIGGTCGLISSNILLFTGNLNNHKNGETIKSFLRNINIYPEYLSKGQLIDVGSIIPVKELYTTSQNKYFAKLGEGANDKI